MARDRKRAKQRKERQERATGAQRRARASAPEHQPPELASGERDVADAQLALGRPELVPGGEAAADAGEAADQQGSGEFADEGEFERLEDRVDDAEERFEQSHNGHATDVDDGAELAPRAARATQPAVREDGNRFANFIRGSWRELQRVQWPDRQQVGQATAVVIGFVIVAGAFLGAMDYVAAKIVDFIV